MRNLRGLIISAVFVLLTLILRWAGDHFGMLMGMVYPFFSKTAVELLASLTAPLDFCLWQVALVVYGVVVAVSFGLVILFRGNLLRWLGAVLVPVTLVAFLHTGLWGLNYSGEPLETAMKLEVPNYTVSDLKETAAYYRDQAIRLYRLVPRDENGDMEAMTLEKMNEVVAKNYDKVVWEYSVFAGPRGPVKELGWSDVCSAMGVDGVMCPLTGEAAVNLNQSTPTLPFAVSRELAHMMAFARDAEADFAAYISCEYSENLSFRYSGYLNAFLACSNSLYHVSRSTWESLWENVPDRMRQDVETINAYAMTQEGQTSQQVEQLRGQYTEFMGGGDGTAYGRFTDLLVAWYVDRYRPVEEVDPATIFDPFDYNEIFSAEPDATESTGESTGGE